MHRRDGPVEESNSSVNVIKSKRFQRFANEKTVVKVLLTKNDREPSRNTLSRANDFILESRRVTLNLKKI